jgi:uncharacterized membrane protein YidH (DUF202 family)
LSNIANRVIEKELINKSNQENEPFYKLISTLLKVSIVLSGLALMLMAIIVYSDIDEAISDIIFYFSVILLCFSGVIACVCPIVIYKTKYTSLNYEKIIS